MQWTAMEATDLMGDVASWEMFASADPEGDPRPLRHFGPLGYAEQDRTATRLLRVLLSATDDPAPADYWAWLDHGAFEPTCIAATEQEMTQKFLLNQEGAPGPREEQQVGLGQILRLRVTVIEEMFLRRSSRHQWRISSAQ